MITALFVETDGVYFELPNIDPWDIKRNALNYNGPHKVIAHPPCKRWGRYWGGGPSVKVKKHLGDDSNHFAHSLWCVRTFGGVIEHPEASYAWKWFGLNKPPRSGGWIEADSFGGLTCCVEQGHYGHKARKATWLYINGVAPVELIWGKAHGKIKIEDGPHSKEEAIKMRSTPNYKPIKRLSVQERIDTPKLFRNVLIKMVNTWDFLQ
jgi:hypothetical protein